MTPGDRAPGPTKQAVTAALSGVRDPELGRDLVTLGMVRDVRIEGGEVTFTVVLTSPACPLRARIEDDCRAAVQALPGVRTVTVLFAADVPRDPRAARVLGPGVRNVVAVASGKGGVGKSTVSVNLACALACGGASVGILDADVYGPNIPLMMGAAGARPQPHGDRGLMPVTAHGVKLMSVGFLVDEATPVVWRGPLLHTTVRQFLADVSWGDLDYLIVDLPPGTGDVAISLSQTVPLTGAVVVTTPQAVSVADVLRCIAMFRLPDIAVPVLGVIENMSGFVAPDTGRRYDIFGLGGGRMVAERTGTVLLGEVPIDPAVRESGDAGVPLVVAQPDSAAAQAFYAVAGRLAGLVSVRHKGAPGPPLRADPDLPIVG